MNVLLASDSNVERAGVCIFMLQWLKEFRKIDENSRIVTYFRKSVIDNEIKEEFVKIGVEVILGNLPQDASSLSKVYRDKVRTDIRDILEADSFDVVHINSSAAGFSTVILSESKKAKVPIRVAHSHGRNTGNGIKNIYLFFLKRYIKKTATKYAGCSLDAGKYLFGDKAIKSSKWFFVPNTVDIDKYLFDESIRCVYREKLGIKDDEILIGAVGMLTELKNHKFLIPIIKELNDRNVRTSLLVLGEGDQRNSIEELVKEYNIVEKVFMPGVSDKVNRWLSAMDFYAMPSLSEGLPISAVEAQANGLYCLLSDRIPKDVDIISGVYHLSVDDNQKEQWINTIASLNIKNGVQRKSCAVTVSNAGFGMDSTKEYIKKMYGVSD